MKINWRAIAAVTFYALGILGWFYIGAWMILTRPVKGLILAHLAGTLSLWKLLAAAIQAFLYLSLAGGVWCIGYMLRNYFEGNE
jgi:hypothetical protein